MNAAASQENREDELLEAFAAGDESATRLLGDGLPEILPEVYQDLRHLAAGYLRNERAGHTLQPTALVHETYLKLLGQRPAFKNRAHFFALAARMMRRILITYAEARKTQKRGAGVKRVALDEALDVFEQQQLPALEINRALNELEKIAPRQAQIAELRFFGGLSVAEAAEVLDVSPATVKRDWSVARLWLQREMAAR